MTECCSCAEQRHVQSFAGSDQVFVQRSEWKFAALREFQIRSVVQSEPVAFSQPGRRRPCLVGSFGIQR